VDDFCSNPLHLIVSFQECSAVMDINVFPISVSCLRFDDLGFKYTICLSYTFPSAFPLDAENEIQLLYLIFWAGPCEYDS
jgi:hypothetical protein